MSLTLQYVIVAVVVALAVAVAVRGLLSVRRKAAQGPVRCAGCPLIGVCKEQNKNKLKKCAPKVAQKQNNP